MENNNNMMLLVNVVGVCCAEKGRKMRFWMISVLPRTKSRRGERAHVALRLGLIVKSGFLQSILYFGYNVVYTFRTSHDISVFVHT